MSKADNRNDSKLDALVAVVTILTIVASVLYWLSNMPS